MKLTFCLSENVTAIILKTGSLDNVIQEFSSAIITMLYKYNKPCAQFFGAFLLIFFYFSFLYFGGVVNKTIIALAFAGY